MTADIYIIYTDQLRLSSVDSPLVYTPNIDRIKKLGTTYTNAYSSSPVCMCARMDFLTGRSAKYHGYWENANHPAAQKIESFASMLSTKGYRTISVGKMHHYPPTEKHGWDELNLMEEIPEELKSDEYLQFLAENGKGDILSPHGVRSLLYHSPQEYPLEQKFHGSEWVTQKSIEKLDAHGDRPVCMMSSYIDPHPPWTLPEKYLDMYKGASLPDTLDAPELQEYSPLPEKDLRSVQEAYYAACTFVDEQIGKLLDYLESSGRLKNSYLIFTTDHGEMLGDRNYFQKFCAYEASSHIPLIIAGKGFNENDSCDIPVTSWDLTSTLLSIGNVDAPEEFIGTSLFNKLEPDRIICFHHGGDPLGPAPHDRYVAALGEGYKYIYSYHSGGVDELYDLNRDPAELNNLAGQNPGVMNVLKNAALNFESQYGQAELVENGNFVNYNSAPVRRNAFFGARMGQLPFWPGTDAVKGLALEEILHCFGHCNAIFPDKISIQNEIRKPLERLKVDPHVIDVFTEKVKAHIPWKS